MRSIRLAYRDRDRLPVIECIREMAGRHYDIDVDVVRIQPTDEYEAALFNDSCDFIVEHLEFLYASAAGGAEVTMFCAPVDQTGADLMVPASINDVSELRGKTIVVRASGRPDSIYMRLKAAGLDPRDTVLVADAEVGRWNQWKKVASGECAAVFMSPLYMPAAEAAGLKVLPVPDLPMVGNFGHACLTRFAAANDALMEDYVRAVVHAVCLMKFRPAEAVAVVRAAPTTQEGTDAADVERRVDIIARTLKTTPFPSEEAIANTHVMAVAEDPASAGVDPRGMWNAQWVERAERSGFIEGLVAELSADG